MKFIQLQQMHKSHDVTYPSQEDCLLIKVDVFLIIFSCIISVFQEMINKTVYFSYLFSIQLKMTVNTLNLTNTQSDWLGYVT